MLSRPYLEGTCSTIRTDHEALRGNLTMAKATGKRTLWRNRLLMLKVDIAHRACIKHRAAEALSRVKTNGENKTPLEDVFPFLTIAQEMFSCAPKTVTTEFEFIEEVKDLFISIIAEVCIIEGSTDNDEAEIPTQAEFFSTVN